MGNVCTKKKGPSRNLTLAIFGLDNAGKTVTTKGLNGETLDSVAPTLGFSKVNFKFGGHDITLYDLGGGKKIRDIWKSYLAEIYALVYVIDASDAKRMDECKHVLANLLHNQQVKGKPILVLANKQDQEGALDEIDICEQLSLEELVNINKCPCRVEMCSAILGYGKKMDPAIRNGMLWLLQTIDNMWDKLHPRVENDIKEKEAREAKELKEKRERVDKLRAERKKKEQEERREEGREDTVSDDDSDAAIKGNPFKRLNYEELQKKEQQLKAEKKKKHEITRPSLEHHSESDNDGDDDTEVPRQLAIKSTREEAETFTASSSPRISRQRGKLSDGSPPKLPYDLELLNHNHNEDSSDSESKQHHRTPRPYDLKPGSSLSLFQSKGLGAGEEEAESHRLGRRLVPLTPLAPLDGGKKKKKKKAKRNQTMPETVDNDTEDNSYQVKPVSLAPRSWSTAAGQRRLTKASKSPELETLNEPESGPEDVGSFSAKWGLDLPDFPSSHANRQPNYDYDHDIVT